MTPMFDRPSRPLPSGLGLQFTETMRGYFSDQVTDDYEQAAEQGKRDGSPLAFTLTIRSEDVQQLLTDPSHRARLWGTVTAPGISADPLTVLEGEFQLFVEDPDQVDTSNMRYAMKLVSARGDPYFLTGFKVIHRGPAYDIWRDTTTLFITVARGDNPQAPTLGKGILTIHPLDFAKQLTTLRIDGTSEPVQRLEALARFGRFFAGELFDVYGGVLAPARVFDPDAPPRPVRPLKTSPPEVHYFWTQDNVRLRLTRFQGGKKGPVILTPGFGTNRRAFTTDTVETNFPEYLVAHGYDVWVFEYRASPDLPSGATQFTLDEIARWDYPGAVDTVRRRSGAATVQAVVHCVGSLTFQMALALGLQGVRSAVCSQLTLHPVPPLLNELKAGLHLASFLTVLGFHTLSTDFDTHADWKEYLFDQVLKLYPTRERCNSPVCRRILFMYGESYEHSQLNEATHEAMHEMFGVANLTTFQHISLILNKGHAVDAAGRDVYLPHADRLCIPIAFLHGANNHIFLPEGSQKTYRFLCQTNGPEYYVRHVLPNYAHMDCFVGKDAARDVYPILVKELDKYNSGS
ncbi:MAG: alpha/beta hydrolase [Gemmataceae bacterium]|nr:alpha/beta hydrolase [Gemmataceae bacterium]